MRFRPLFLCVLIKGRLSRGIRILHAMEAFLSAEVRNRSKFDRMQCPWIYHYIFIIFFVSFLPFHYNQKIVWCLKYQFTFIQFTSFTKDRQSLSVFWQFVISLWRMRCQKLMSHKSGTIGKFNVLLNSNSVYFEKKVPPSKSVTKQLLCDCHGVGMSSRWSMISEAGCLLHWLKIAHFLCKKMSSS